MELKKIEALVKIVEHSSLQEFNYEDEDIKIHLSKKCAAPAPGPGMMPMMPGMGGYLPMGTPPAGTASATTESYYEEEPLFITSPIVGTFYSAPAPDAPAFVHVGDQVKNGATVCILEAMKLMNEIQCEFDCLIEAVLVSNEQKVEYGQPLFRIKRL